MIELYHAFTGLAVLGWLGWSLYLVARSLLDRHADRSRGE